MSEMAQKGTVRWELGRSPSRDAERATRTGRRFGLVLLVEDEPLTRKIISGRLGAEGYIVQTAVDGLDAVGKLRAGLPDLIISDLDMPHMSGVEFLHVIRKRFPQIPVIVMRSVAADEMSKEAPADAYYRKSEFGFWQILITISDLERNPPRRGGPLPIDNEQVQARWDEDGHCIIHCEDCLREFRDPRVFRMGRNETWTICAHCGRFVRLSIAEESKAA